MDNQEIIIGNNLQVITEFLKRINATKIFFVVGKKSFELSGSKSYLTEIINDYACVYYSDFSENPKIEDVYTGIEIFNRERCDCCISIGGGSVLDMGKLICYLREDPTNNPNRLVKNEVFDISRKTHLIAIPTTSGSGAESTHFSVVYINNRKYSLAHKTILPDIVNINAKLSYTLNPYLKAVTGLDALAQSIESYWSRNATLQSRRYSTTAIKLIWSNLLKSVLDNDFSAHSNVVVGSNFAGRAINIAKTTAAHAISYYFSSKHKISHGHAVALNLGNVYEFNFLKAHNSNSKIKNVFNELNSLLDIVENPRKVLEKYISDLNIELDYSKLNINILEELPKIKSEINIERLRNNPFDIEEKDLEEIILNNC